MAKMDIIIGVIFFDVDIFSPLVWFISSSLSFRLACPPSLWRGQNLSLYLPPLEKGDRGGFLKKSILHKISPCPSLPKRGSEGFPTSGNDNLIHQPVEQGSI
jgi:hypothetical protein